MFSETVGLRIHFIDVGEGDSVLIEALDGGCALVDAGNLISGFKVVEYLKKRGIDSIEHLMFTHPHLDHIGGAFFVLQMFDVKNVYDNGQGLSGQDIYRGYSKLVRENDKYSILKAGDSILLGEMSLEVLWPQAAS
ncbi:MAG: MBL fold metallo-hydrolase [Candidatus Omnitrophota bacterium]